MKKKIISFISTSIIAVGGFPINQISSKNLENAYITKYESTMRQDLLCLMVGYAGFITKIEKNTNGNVYIVMKSGKKILYDDRKVKNFTQKLDNPDLQDMLEQVYPISGKQILQNTNFDPGRRRVYSFFNEIYGRSKIGVQSKLIGVKIATFIQISPYYVP